VNQDRIAIINIQDPNVDESNFIKLLEIRDKYFGYNTSG
jgi:hypothetical protein